MDLSECVNYIYLFLFPPHRREKKKKKEKKYTRRMLSRPIRIWFDLKIKNTWSPKTAQIAFVRDCDGLSQSNVSSALVVHRKGKNQPVNEKATSSRGYWGLKTTAALIWHKYLYKGFLTHRFVRFWFLTHNVHPKRFTQSNSIFFTLRDNTDMR